ncbi:MAG: hypothetical protein GWN93_02585, partial [Deltaproteobacteria bacterium]|nr:hypothetical protein [Deltaproteobacteria bacterium]
TEAYHYWYAPENSFGIQDMRTVNWSFFKEKFTKHTYWRLQYKRYEWNDWTNGNQYLTVNRTWNESGFWKINLTFTAPVDVYEARFIFACNLSVLQYVEKDDYEVWLNYSFNATENISIMFNWSDLTQYQNLYYQKGVQNGKFYFLFGKQNIHAGEYVFDPNFGYEGEGSDTCTGIEDRISGSPYTISEDGTAENISVYLMLNDWADIEGGETVKCMLYNNATNALVGETETMELSMANGPPNYAWYTFWFTNGSEPSLSSGTSYMITVWADDSDGDITSMDNNDGLGYCERNGNAPFNGAPDPHGMVKWSDDNVSIYCTYSTAAGETWNETESWNITLTNGTFVWDDHNIESWNITLTNGTFVWDDHNINSWNVTLVNGTFDWEEEIESWNTTLVNLTWDWTGNNI